MRIWICSGEVRRPENGEVSSLLGALCYSFLQKPPGSSLEGSQVIDVDEATPDLEGPLILQPPESPGHSLPIGPDHGAKVLMSVACGYANLPGSLHPLALDEEEEESLS